MDIEKGTYTYTDSDGQEYKVPIERVYSLSQLLKGDHIAIKRRKGCYWHHAIGEDVETEKGIINVIEYSNSAKGFSQDNSTPPKDPRIAKVRRGKYSGLKDELYLIKHKKYLPARTVIWRARSRLGERAYSLSKNNCEHFAMWCKTGISSSEQVKNIEERVTKDVREEIEKNAVPLIVSMATKTASKGGEEIVRTTVHGMTKEVATETVSKGGQQIVKASAQTAVKRGFTETVSKGGQQIVKASAQTAVKRGFTETVSKGGQQIVKASAQTAAKQVVTQPVSKGGQEIMKAIAQTVARETSREVVTKTSITTGSSAGGSLMGGGACAALFETGLAAYDISCLKTDLKAGKISQKEYEDAVGKRIVGGVGSITGSTVGAALGQALIPVPIVGGIVGGVVGALVGQFSGNTFWNGAM